MAVITFVTVTLSMTRKAVILRVLTNFLHILQLLVFQDSMKKPLPLTGITYIYLTTEAVTFSYPCSIVYTVYLGMNSVSTLPAMNSGWPARSIRKFTLVDRPRMIYS